MLDVAVLRRLKPFQNVNRSIVTCTNLTKVLSLYLRFISLSCSSSIYPTLPPKSLSASILPSLHHFIHPSLHASLGVPIPASNRPPISPLPSISSTLRPMHHPSLPTCKRPSISQSLSPNLPPFLNATLPPSLHPTIPPTIPSSHHPSIHLSIQLRRPGAEFGGRKIFCGPRFQNF